MLMADLIEVHFFIYLTVRPSTDGKRAPLTAINLQAAGSPQQAPPTYIAKMWKLIKFRKNVIFSRNHTDVNPDDWTITKKTIRTTIHENFSKMKNLKVDRWALSLMAYLLLWLRSKYRSLDLCQGVVVRGVIGRRFRFRFTRFIECHKLCRYNNEQTTKQTKAINNSYIYIYHVNVTQTVPDISPLMPMHQDPLLVYLFIEGRGLATWWC